jgi:anti-anti-sigma factor
MTVSAQWHQQANQLTLTGEVDFNNVVALLREAEAWLKNTTSAQCVLELSCVAYSNSAGIALIMSLHRRAHALGKQLVVGHVPANLVSMARLGGLEWLIDGPSAPPTHELANS